MNQKARNAGRSKIAGDDNRLVGAPLLSSEKALRRRAEVIARQSLIESLETHEELSTEALQQQLHELRVQQLQLQMQNEELRRAQAALCASRARYIELYDLAPVGCCTLDADQRIAQANFTVTTMLGVPRGGLIMQPIARFILPADQDIYDQHRQQLIAAGASPPCELRLVKGNGTTLWVHLAAVAAQDLDGKPISHVVLSDITEHKRTEEALREQKEFFHLIAENIGDFIAVLDLDGRRLYNSPSYAQFFGSADDLRGTDSFAEIHPEDLERVKQVFRETVQTGRGRQIDYRFLMADGSIREMESRGSVIRDGEGRITRVVVVSHDITERKQTEEHVRQLAFYDPLTKLPNRRLLNDRLNQTMAASMRNERYAAVIFLDLDNFKPLNDTHGHEVGDLLLIEAADRLKACVREMDTVARFGGDEFVVMINELEVNKAESTAQAGIIAEKIRTALAEPYFLTVAQEGKIETTVEHHCSASIGVTLFIDHQASPDDIIKQADAAMYRAKKAGRNSIRFSEQ